MNVVDVVDKLKESIKIAINEEKYENALEYINLAGSILYNYNQCYFDKELEESIEIISYKILGKSKLDKLNNDTIVFYDGFGLDTRGLAQIYLQALSKFKKVVYITKEKQKNDIPTIKSILIKSNNISYFIPETAFINKINFVKALIEEVKPKSIFMYTVPDDVIITTILHYYKNVIDRYQINLTDHAFWLGGKCIDYCIEFRNYGSYISNKYRQISEKNLILLPYYPIVNTSVKFEGYPFKFNVKNKKVIFSGGSLYKTFGGDDKYYILVDYILRSFDDTIFWYAGNGDRSKFDLLIKKYPNRIFLTSERKDLFQVLKHSYFYLSTYPICGGLMFQYAAVAGKLPLTLKYDDCTEGFLIAQESLDIEFDDIDVLKEKIKKVLQDEKYLEREKNKIFNSVISPQKFEENLKYLLERQKTAFKIELKPIENKNLLQEYANNMTYKNLCNIVAAHRKFCVFKLLPKEFLYGIYLKVKKIIN